MSSATTPTNGPRSMHLVTPSGLDTPAMTLPLDNPDRLPLDSELSALVDSRRLLIGVATGPLGARASEVAKRLDLTVGAEEPSHARWIIKSDDPEQEAQRLIRAATSRPGATLTTSALLRMVEQIDPASGLRAESFAYSMLLAGAEFASWLAESRRPAPARPATHALVHASLDGTTLSVVLNNTKRRNAYGAAMRDELLDVLRTAVLDPSISNVVLTGAGPVFCSGGDLAEFGSAGDPVYADLTRTTAGVAWALQRLTARLEVRVHGATVGAGVEFAAFGANVRAAAGTSFRLPELSMGLLPGAGGTVSLTRRIGRWRLMYLLLTAETLNCERARVWGLVDEIDADLDQTSTFPGDHPYA